VDVGNFIYDPSEILSLEWPSFRKINVKQIYDWMDRKNISFQNFSKGEAHRALIAYANISRSSYYSIEHHLMWSMYGIEAIYTKGNDRILRQINERTQLILGKVTGLQNSVKKLYDWRSKFAHGKLDLLMVYSEANILEPKQNNFYNDASHQIKLAIYILIASIQELVLQDRTEFDFPPIMSRWERIKSVFNRYLNR